MCRLPSIPTYVVLCSCLMQGAASAQLPQRTVFPLDHRAPAGKAAHWNVLARPSIFGYPQPVRISVPGAARVTFFDGVHPEGVTVDAPGQARLPVGFAYRVRISELAGHPGVELYPTIEVLDRLHPPAEQIDEYPIPVDLTEEEIEAVLSDRMVTKVVYLERQDLPRPPYRRAAVSLSEVAATANLLESAGSMGRPMAIVRFGGRTLTAEERSALSPPVPLQMTQVTRQAR